MARDIRFEISARVDRAEAAIRDLQRTGQSAASILERDFNQLGTRSAIAFDGQRQAAQSAFDRIKSSGIATNDELKRAQRGLADELTRIDEDQYGRRVGLAQRFKDNWVTITAGISSAYVVADFARNAVNQFQAFETALTDMARVTSEPLDQVKQKIMELPPELGSATQLVQGYYQVISAGVTDPERAMQTLVTAAMAAKAAHIDQGEAVKALTQLMAGFGEEIANAEDASDLLLNIERYGQTTVAELTPVIGSLASISNQLNVMPNEMGAVLSQITLTAGGTAQAATQYQAIMTGLIRPTQSMFEVLKNLGYETAQSLIADHGLSGALMMIKNESDRAFGPNGLGQIFGTKEAIVGLGPLFEDQFRNVNQVMNDMERNAGATKQAFDDWKVTFDGVKTVFDNTIGKAMISIGEQLAPIVMDAMRSISTWITTNQAEIVQFVEGLIAVAGVVRTVAGWVISYVRAIAEFYAEVYLQIEGIYNGIMDMVSTPINIVVNTIRGVTSAVSSAGSSSAVSAGGSSDSVYSDEIDPTTGGYYYDDTGYAVGTAYVPRDGWYPLHRGEQVSTRGEVSAQTGSSAPVINIGSGAINITLPNLTNQSTARDLARELLPEIMRLSRERYSYA